MSRRKFAAHIGVNQSSVQRWELENQIPKGDVLKRLASDFNVDLNWLLTGEGDGPFVHPRHYPDNEPFFFNGPARLGVSEPEAQWETAGDAMETHTTEPPIRRVRHDDQETSNIPSLAEPGFDQTLEREFNELVIAFIREILSDPKGAKWFKRLFIRNFPEFTEWLIARNLER